MNPTLQTLMEYPKSTLLFLIASLNLILIFYFFVFKKGFRQDIYRGYFIYALFAILWVITNAYFQSKFLVTSGALVTKFMAILANITAACSIIGFYYISCAIKDRKISTYSWILMTFLWVMAFLFNSIPNLTVKGVNVFEPGRFQILQGAGTGTFFLTGVVVIILSVVNFLLALRKDRSQIEKVKIFYILLAMGVMYTSIILFLIILPFYFQNYDYAWLPPFISILEVVTVGYAILVKRFYNLWNVLTQLSKLAIALLGANILSLWSTEALLKNENTLLRWGIFLAFAYGIYHFFNSRTFYNSIGGTSSTHIEYLAKDLKEWNPTYETPEAFQDDLQKAFKERQLKMTPKIKFIDAEFQKKYPEITNYFSKNHQPLIAEELRFKDEKTKKIKLLLAELESLGDICLPLHKAPKKITGILTLNHKKQNYLYKKEEIKALKKLQKVVDKIVNIST